MGYYVLTLAQLGISVNIVVSKFLLEVMPMFMLLACRFCISTIILGSIVKFTKTSFAEPEHPDGKLTKKDWMFAALQGIFAAFLFNLFFMWGLQHTTAMASGIISSALPAIITCCAVWFLKEKLNMAKSLGLVLAVVGIVIINIDHVEAEGSSVHTYLGDFLVLVALFPEALYSIVSRKLAGRMTPLAAAFIANGVGFVSLLSCAFFAGPIDFSYCDGVDLCLLVVSALCSLVFFWGWGWGLSCVPATTAAVFGGVMPVAISILAIFFLGESLHWYDTLGIVFVLLSIVVGTGWRPRFLQKTDLTEV